MSAPSTPTDQEIPRGVMPIRNTPPKRPRLEPKTNGPQGEAADNVRVPLDAANAVRNYFSLRAAALPAILPHGGPPAPINDTPPGPAGAGGSA